MGGLELLFTPVPNWREAEEDWKGRFPAPRPQLASVPEALGGPRKVDF